MFSLVPWQDTLAIAAAALLAEGMIDHISDAAIISNQHPKVCAQRDKLPFPMHGARNRTAKIHGAAIPIVARGDHDL